MINNYSLIEVPGSSIPAQVKSAPSEQSIVQPFLLRQSAESVGSHIPGCDRLAVLSATIPTFQSNNKH